MDARVRVQAELSYARAARAQGKEGRARVCARRAAGWAIAARYPELPQRSALSLLRWLQDHGPAELQGAAGRLLAGVDEQHRLPHSEDPLEDAQRIVAGMIGAEAGA